MAMVVEHNRKIRADNSLKNGGSTRDRTDDLIFAHMLNKIVNFVPVSR